MRNVTRGTLDKIADWVAPEPTAEDRIRDAAPALLAALEYVDLMWEMSPKQEGTPFWNAANAARAAISAARGGA